MIDRYTVLGDKFVYMCVYIYIYIYVYISSYQRYIYAKKFLNKMNGQTCAKKSTVSNISKRREYITYDEPRESKDAGCVSSAIPSFQLELMAEK